jgi:hypothetical protein
MKSNRPGLLAGGNWNNGASSGSQVLLDQCKSYEAELPFLTTVKRIEKYFSFT